MIIVRLCPVPSLLVLLLLHSNVATAVCLDPITFVSGYTVPLEREVRQADAIVVGRVLSERALQDDPADPDGVTAYDLSVRVLASLKGRLPRVIVVRNENTSARYAMSVGEEHLLFVSRADGKLWVDSCGNSAPMPAGEKLVREVRMQLEKLK